ncbi:MAG: TlpA family protein disulfide reductase [Deltaproteobacteria bacterium]|nr:TlpA family protein disulfide reductase [Deltaproteobacteria bacterium]
MEGNKSFQTANQPATPANQPSSTGGKEGSNIIAVIVVAIAVVAVAAFVLSQRQQFEPVLPGAKAVDFTLPDLSGKERSLKDFKGKVVFLNFWATWCKPCGEEMPSMQALYDSMRGRPFEIVAVSVDTEGSEVVADFVKKNNLTFSVLHDRKGRTKETYKTTGVPETFIIDQNGVIAEKVWGPRDWRREENLTMISELLQNGPRPPESYRTGK